MLSIRELGFRYHPLFIVFVYVLFSVSWILWSDIAVERTFADPGLLTAMQSFKGVIYVLFSAGILYALMMFGLRRLGKTVAELKESRARFADLAEMSADWYWETDAAMRFTYLSEGLKHQTGVDASNLLGKRRDQLDPNFEKNEAWHRHLETLEQRKPFRDFVYQSRLDDYSELRTFSVSGKPHYDADGEFVGYRGATREITELARAQQVTRAAEAKLRTLFDALPVALVTFAPKRGALIEFVNQTTTQLFGFRKEELLGRMPLELSPERQPCGTTSAKLGRDMIRRALDGETVITEWQFRHADGTEFSGEVRVTCVELLGRTMIYIGVVDITERKRAEQELAERTKVLETVFEVSPLSLSVRDSDGRLLYVNQRAANMYGCKPEDILGQSAEEMLNGEDPEFDPAYSHVLKSLEPMINQELESPRFPGKTRLVSAVPFEANGKTRILTVGFDISERKRAERELEERTKLLETIFEVAPVAISVRDKNLQYRHVNQKFASLYGVTSAELIGRTADEATGRVQPPVHPRTFEVIEKGKSFLNEESVSRRFPEITNLFSMVPVELGDGERLVLTVATDITERKRVEQELVVNERRFRNLAEGSIQGILVHQQCRPLYANDAFARIYGFESAADILALESIIPCFHEDDRVRLLGYQDARLAGRPAPRSHQYRVVKPDGSIAWIRSYNSVVNWDDMPSVQTTIIDVTDQVVAERESAQRQNLFETVCDSLPAMISLRDENARFLYANREFRQCFGYGETDIIGKTVTETDGPVKSRGNGEQYCLDVARTGKPITNMEFNPPRYPQKQLLASWTPLMIGEDNKTAVLSVAVDITSQKNAQMALRKNAETLRFLNEVTATVNEARSVDEALGTVLETIRAFVGWPVARATLYRDSSGNPDAVAFERMDPLRATEHAVLARYNHVDGGRCVDLASLVRETSDTVWREKAALQILPDDDADAAPNLVEGSCIAFPIVSGDKVLATIELYNSSETIRQDRVVEALAYAAAQLSRLLERFKAASDLRSSEIRYRSLIDQSSQAIIVYGAVRIVLANRAAARLFGYDGIDDLMAEPMLEKLIASEAWKTFHHNNTMVLDGKRMLPEAVDFVGVRKDGKRFSIIGRPALVEWGDGSVISCALTDISREQEIEERKRQAQRMESLGKLTGGIAHDFNNLLGIIIGGAGLLERDLHDQPKSLKRLNIIKHAASRGEKMTGKMLGFARNDASQSSVLALHEIAPTLEELLQKSLTHEIDLRFQIAPEVWPVQVDAGELEDAIINLVVNARDATESHGEIAVEMSNTHIAGEPEIPDGDYVVIAVSDDGCGMSEEAARRAFDPFFTTKDVNKGTGLGLSMVYGFVRRFNGHVRLYSELGKGTTVKLYLPRTKRDSDATAPRKEARLDIPKGTETLLVVDDERALLTITKQTLEKLGYRIRTARCADEAFTILREDDTIDLLFSDVVMPGECNGIELSAAARAIRPELPVLLTSGFSAQLQGRGHDPELIGAILAKPYDRGGLARAVRAALDAKGLCVQNTLT